ncbi:MAG TPA: ribonuclease HIII [Armatimonadota bacterium]|nr:ribonuclease HIII [Armatimonadota bacterium]
MSEPTTSQGSHIGTDEAGKGDYFGPLAVAAVYADTLALERLPQAGVKDSKRISSVRRLWELEKAVKQICPAFEVVLILPTRYNELIEKTGNLNRLLAWAHARAIENVLEKKPDCPLAVTDQFGDESYLRQSLMTRGRGIRLLQRVRAEDDPAVGAASTLARAAFVRSLERLSAETGITLPRGAAHVVPTARQIYDTGGEELLRRVAKWHFKTTKQVVG